MSDKINKWKKTHKRVMAILSSSSEEDIPSFLIEEPVSEVINENDENSNDSYSSGPLEGTSDSSDSSSAPSSDTDSGHDDEEVEFCAELAACSIKNKWTRSSTNELLTLLRGQGHNLPKDARTLWKTPRQVSVQERCGGEFTYFGIRNGLERCLSQGIFEGEAIELEFNVDGIPLFKSSNMQMWPILGSFNKQDIFIIAIYYGGSKPISLMEYLDEFLVELNELLMNGLFFDQKHYNISLKCFLCDAPARSFLKGIIMHTGYSSCERCCVHGSYQQSRVVFNEEHEYEHREENKYREFRYNDHHQIVLSPLLSAGLNIIHTFPLDYMHLVCLGVVRRITYFWRKGPIGKMSSQQLKEISNMLLSYNGSMPSEFARQPRSLDDLDRWKATEFRQFLLYTGPVVLRHILPENSFNHFISLSMAISILLQSNDMERVKYLEYARDLLKHFVFNAKYIYGETFTVYNVHNLLHLTDDCINHSTSLNRISCFPYENFLQRIKKSVRNSSNPITQVAKRQAEYENVYGSLSKKNLKFKITNGRKDNCFLTNSAIVFVKQVNDDSYICHNYKFRHLESVYDVPEKSQLLHIVLLPNRNKKKYSVVVLKRDSFLRKCVCLPESRGYAIFPLLHENDYQ